MAGGYTLIQDEASSVISGMPRAAREIETGTEQLALTAIAESLGGLKAG